jgi:ubiquinone/menaquinone biosynthesis C-methylase UbiE
MTKQKYLHGFSRTEQERLMTQAEFLEPFVYSGVDLEFNHQLLEVGCGVGAQSKILCRRFPKLKIHGVDLSKEQLSVAKVLLMPEIKQKRIQLSQQNALKLNLKNKKFDSAFLCWFLEHVPDPLKALKKVRSHLKPGAKIYCSEVFNQTLFVQPYSPNFMRYWFQFNDLQWALKGHPFVGASLGHLLQEAGYKNIKVESRPFHFDSREPERRAEFTEYFLNILLSAKDALISDGRVTPNEVDLMMEEMRVVKKAKDAVFFYTFIRATGVA